ncbi:uncharacterized protein LOC131869257 [Cryptomeria japonica]|uniref:uncharacterized protein LOC131869257 n=1 Tax=Cryptomeria japonica TaxID=3369 RepID=UPI0027D9EC76|nr:uncharacterized protein LOC131869257 [Cryptomeria japonica]
MGVDHGSEPGMIGVETTRAEEESTKGTMESIVTSTTERGSRDPVAHRWRPEKNCGQGADGAGLPAVLVGGGWKVSGGRAVTGRRRQRREAETVDLAGGEPERRYAVAGGGSSLATGDSPAKEDRGRREPEEQRRRPEKDRGAAGGGRRGRTDRSDKPVSPVPCGASAGAGGAGGGAGAAAARGVVAGGERAGVGRRSGGGCAGGAAVETGPRPVVTACGGGRRAARPSKKGCALFKQKNCGFYHGLVAACHVADAGPSVLVVAGEEGATKAKGAGDGPGAEATGDGRPGRRRVHGSSGGGSRWKPELVSGAQGRVRTAAAPIAGAPATCSTC